MAGPYDSRAVANAILQYARETKKNITLMQLIKLVYVANGWSLALLDYPLFEEQVQAWQYGPVIPNVYRAFNRFGSAPVTDFAMQKDTGLPYTAQFDPVEESLLKAVVNSYGDMHAFQLSNKMHEPGTPWTLTFKKSGAYSVIPPELIKEHFLELKAQRNISL